MAKLNEEEASALEKLIAKRDAPDEPAAPSSTRNENINVTIDLGDPAQVEQGLRLGLLRRSDLEDDAGGGDEEGEPEKDAAPARKLDKRYS